MPNKNSHAGHIPIRTCVICRGRYEQHTLRSIVVLREGLVIDMHNILPGRKNYVCPENDCLSGLDRWMKKYKKKTRASAAKMENQSGK